jgi:thermitase
MRRYHIFWTILILIGILGTSTEQARSETKPSDPSAGADEQAFAPGRIIVKAEEEAPANAVESLNRENDASIEERLPVSGVEIVDLPRDLSVSEAVERYEASPNVEYAEPDFEVRLAATPNDPRFPSMYNLENTGQSVGGVAGTPDADIDASKAWDVTSGSMDTVVAIIDTGVDINHPDLEQNVWTNPGEVPGNGIDDDDNNYVDDVHGWDFYHNDNSVFDSSEEDHHGTHVAGTIAARGNNGVGITGIAWQARVMPLKVFGPDRGYVSDAIEALNYAVDNGTKISNNSYAWHGTGSYSQSFADALEAANARGHLFVAAAANNSLNNDSIPHYPASYDSSNIISVAATDNTDSLTSFSNYGATSVDLAAPGVGVLSTYTNDTYAWGKGTSMATPHVAGTAALIQSAAPDLDDSGIKARILSSVDRKPSLEGKTVTGGRLNAAEALDGLGVNTEPVIARPGPRGNIKDRTPILKMRVYDRETELTGDDIRVYIDGKRIDGFSYNSKQGQLVFEFRNKLSYGAHRVQVIAEDEKELTNESGWKFRVLR